MMKDSEKIKDINDCCSICLESLVHPFEEMETLKCGHNFHNSCITKWITTI